MSIELEEGVLNWFSGKIPANVNFIKIYIGNNKDLILVTCNPSVYLQYSGNDISSKIVSTEFTSITITSTDFLNVIKKSTGTSIVMSIENNNNKLCITYTLHGVDSATYTFDAASVPPNVHIDSMNSFNDHRRFEFICSNTFYRRIVDAHKNSLITFFHDRENSRLSVSSHGCMANMLVGPSYTSTEYNSFVFDDLLTHINVVSSMFLSTTDNVHNDGIIEYNAKQSATIEIGDESLRKIKAANVANVTGFRITNNNTLDVLLFPKNKDGRMCCIYRIPRV